MNEQNPSLAGRTVVLTGANSGIGKETAVGLARLGASIVAIARDRNRGERAVAEIRERAGNESVRLELADLAVMEQVRDLAGRLLEREPQIDVLINNAGVVFSNRRTTADGFEATFAINHLAPYLLTRLLLERIRESAPARILNVSSRAHARAEIDWDDLQNERAYRAMKVYGQTKLMNILFTRELARRLEGSGVVANCLHPGVVRTAIGADGDLGGLLGVVWRLVLPFVGVSPEKGARTTIYLATSEEGGRVSGEYFDDCAIGRCSSRSRDEEAARRLWEVSAELVGLDP